MYFFKSNILKIKMFIIMNIVTPKSICYNNGLISRNLSILTPKARINITPKLIISTLRLHHKHHWKHTKKEIGVNGLKITPTIGRLV